jgi:hypothetical protein
MKILQGMYLQRTFSIKKRAARPKNIGILTENIVRLVNMYKFYF